MYFPIKGYGGYPLAHMIADSRSAKEFIYFRIRSPRRKREINFKFTIKLFVIDFSFIFVHGILKTFNNITLKMYLQNCSEIITFRWSLRRIQNFTFVQLCGWHIFRAFSKKLTSLKLQDDSIHYLKKCMSVLINCTLWYQIEKVLILLFIILLSETKNPLFKEAITEANVIIKNDQLNIELTGKWDNYDKETADDAEFEKYFYSATSSCKSSSFFFKKINTLLDNVKQNLPKSKKSEEKNLLHCPQFVNYLVNHYLFLIPLWTGLMLSPERYCSDYNKDKKLGQPKIEASESRATNSSLESFFGGLKEDILRKSVKNRLHIVEYLGKLSEHMIASHRAYKIHVTQVKAREIQTAKRSLNNKKYGNLQFSDNSDDDSDKPQKNKNHKLRDDTKVDISDNSNSGDMDFTQSFYKCKEEFKKSSGRKVGRKQRRYMPPNKPKTYVSDSSGSSSSYENANDRPKTSIPKFESRPTPESKPKTYVSDSPEFSSSGENEKSKKENDRQKGSIPNCESSSHKTNFSKRENSKKTECKGDNNLNDNSQKVGNPKKQITKKRQLKMETNLPVVKLKTRKILLMK